MTVSELSKRLSLSRPSVSERILRLQEKGVIQGISAKVSPAAVGRNTIVFIQISELKISYHEFEQKIAKDLDIIECHRLTGRIDYMLKAAVGSMTELNQLVERLMIYCSLNTSVVLASPVANRLILPKEK